MAAKKPNKNASKKPLLSRNGFFLKVQKFAGGRLHWNVGKTEKIFGLLLGILLAGWLKRPIIPLQVKKNKKNARLLLNKMHLAYMVTKVAQFSFVANFASLESCLHV
ncbi:MAG: hypothetical protein GX946_08030 [Oligosphaeraceae bacterium]|nr:hypothetical protein [Oligosphaeraceae bacterium]